MTSLISTWPWLNIFPNWPILLMEEIPNNHLGCMKACTWWYKLPIKSYQLCRISSINSITRKMRVTCEVSELKFRSIQILFFCCDWSKDNLKVLLENRWEFRWLVFLGCFMEKGLSTKSVPFLGCSYVPPELMPAENLAIKIVSCGGVARSITKRSHLCIFFSLQ